MVLSAEVAGHGGCEGRAGCLSVAAESCRRSILNVMVRLVRLATLLLALVAVAATGRVSAQQQTTPTNLDFETGTPGELPTGWIMSVAQPQPGVSARIVTDERRNGAQAVRLTREPSAAAGASLNLLQLVDVRRGGGPSRESTEASVDDGVGAGAPRGDVGGGRRRAGA